MDRRSSSERLKHFRDRAHETGIASDSAPLEITNHACDRYAKILKEFNLVQVGSEEAKAVKPTQNPDWQTFAKALEDWFRLELLYSALCCQKSLPALNVLISCFWTLDAQRLKRLNLQMQLDIIVTNASTAHKLGWDNIMLGKHTAFLKQYAQGVVWQEKDLTTQRNWIQPVFHSLCKFYGSCSDWPDGY